MPSLSDVFGPVLIVAAVVLALWEARAYRRRDEDDWLVTPRRLRRRMAVAAILCVIGLTICLEGAGVIATTGRPGVLLAYVAGLGGLSIGLMVLAVMDLHDTAALYARRSMRDFEQAVTGQDSRPGTTEQADRNPDDGTA